MKKVNEVSKAAAKEDIVEAAEDHAKKLSEISEDLEKYDVKQIPNFILTLQDLIQFTLIMISLLVLCSRCLHFPHLFLCFLTFQGCEKCQRTF